MVLFVRNEPADILVVSCLNNSAFPQVALVFPRLRGKDVAGEGVASFYFAGTGFPKPFCGSSVCLDFRHFTTPSLRNYLDFVFGATIMNMLRPSIFCFTSIIAMS